MKLKSILSAFAASALAALSIVGASAPAQAGANNCGDLLVSPIHSSTFYIDPANSFDANYIGYSVKNNGSSSVSGKTLKINSLSGGTVTLVTGEANTRSLGTIAAGATVYTYFFAKSSATGDLDPSTTTISVSIKSGSTVNCTISDSLTAIDDVLDTNASTIDSVTVTPSTAEVNDGDLVTVAVAGDSGNIGNGTAADPESFIFAPVVQSANFDPAHYRLVSITHNGCNTLNIDNALRHINLGSDCDNSYITTYTFKAMATQTQTIASYIDGQSYVASGAQIKHPGVVTAVALPLVKKSESSSSETLADTGSSSAMFLGLAALALVAAGAAIRRKKA